MTKGGYHSVTARYDELGNKIEWTNFGKKGERVNDTAGYHRARMSYDLRGNETEITYFNTAGNRVAGSNKFARRQIKYDGRDNAIEVAYYGSDNLSTDPGKGYAVLQHKYDDQDRLTYEALFNVDGQLRAGSAVGRWRYYGNEIDEHDYDAAGEMISIQGCKTSHSILDLRTNSVTEVSCRDEKGPLIRSNFGWAFRRMKYDTHLREIEIAWYREDGHLASSPDYAMRRRKVR